MEFSDARWLPTRHATNAKRWQLAPAEADAPGVVAIGKRLD